MTIYQFYRRKKSGVRKEKKYYQKNRDKINDRRRAKYAQKHPPKQNVHTVKSLQATAKMLVSEDIPD